MAPIIETVFSLVFIFLVFSLITSWIVEYVAMQRQKRGKMLRQFITTTLDDHFNKNWGLLLYSHPLIEALHHDMLLEGYQRLLSFSRLKVKRRLPAYIPSAQFATALVDIIINNLQTSTFEKDPANGIYRLQEAAPLERSFAAFLNGVNAMKESEVKITLAALAQHIQKDAPDALSQMTAAIAAWYDSGMERLNGWYKRKIRNWLFGVGWIVAIVFNVNTLVVVSRLYSDPQMRASVSKAADAYLAKYKELPTNSGSTVEALSKRIDSLRGMLSVMNLPIGWNWRDTAQGAESTPGKAFAVTVTKAVKDSVFFFIDSATHSSDTVITIGNRRVYGVAIDSVFRKRDTSLKRDTTALPSHQAQRVSMGQAARLLGKSISLYNLVGWLLTALALSFGAPFWFDALKKIANVRSAGQRPAPQSSNTDPGKKPTF